MAKTSFRKIRTKCECGVEIVIESDADGTIELNACPTKKCKGKVVESKVKIKRIDPFQ